MVSFTTVLLYIFTSYLDLRKNNKNNFSAFAICRILATQNHQSETPTIHISLDAKLLSRHRPKRRQR